MKALVYALARTLGDLNAILLVGSPALATVCHFRSLLSRSTANSYAKNTCAATKYARAFGAKLVCACSTRLLSRSRHLCRSVAAWHARQIAEVRQIERQISAKLESAPLLPVRSGVVVRGRTELDREQRPRTTIATRHGTFGSAQIGEKYRKSTVSSDRLCSCRHF
jgi:hypothetical protein